MASAIRLEAVEQVADSCPGRTLPRNFQNGLVLSQKEGLLRDMSAHLLRDVRRGQRRGAPGDECE